MIRPPAAVAAAAAAARAAAIAVASFALASLAFVSFASLASLACRGERADPTPAAIAETFARELGQRPRVVCARDACTATLPDGTNVPIARDGGAWESPELLDGRAVAARVAEELAGLGVTETVDCGGVLVAPPAPTAITCRLGGGGTAWVTVGGDGAIALEVALTAVTAAARTTGPGDAVLDRASRALDTDEAQGNAEPAPDDRIPANH